MKYLVSLVFMFSIVVSNAQFAKYVNPFIGTGGTGHTFPGATTPFAMVQLSPDTRIDGSWEGCSGYHYSDSIIHGFSHTHLSGTGCSDYGDIAFMPYFSKTDVFEKLKTTDVNAKFSHKNEKASAGFYSVLLDDLPVKVELTATTRTGFQRYTFNEEGFGYVILNLKHRDELLEGTINEKANLTFSGLRRSKAWAANQELYYGIEMHSPLQANKKGFYNYNYITKEGTNDTKLIVRFRTYKGLQLLIKTGLSTCDERGAMANLNEENPTWDFELIKKQAFTSWEKELTKIEVEDAKLPKQTQKLKDNLAVFYTALYHCMIHPSIMNDVDGRYKGRDGKIHKAEGFNYYTVFSLWDTHRALHPLLNLIDKKRSHDFVITFLKQFEQSGRLPMWELWNNETDCMIGFHSVSVILDAYKKQVISKAELQQLWPAVKAEAMSNRFGLDKFRDKGFLSVEDESESVSKTAEYSYDMWCVSEIARELGLGKTIIELYPLQNAVEELYNSKTGFLQPRKNGNWLKNFNPYEVNSHYTEANAWQYSFYAPHQNFYAGNKTFYEQNPRMLDSLFTVKTNTDGRAQADITGLIGQYAHGNEPSHNYIYLLSNNNKYQYLKFVLDSFYTNKPDGLIGNEDCGQMSAWYVMSALGFYQTCPGRNEFTNGVSLYENFKINLENKITVKFDSSTVPYRNNYLRLINEDYRKWYEEEKKPKEYGLRRCSLRNSSIQSNASAPLIIASENKPFFDSCLISIELNNSCYQKADIEFSLNSGERTLYKSPFWIYNDSKIIANIKLEKTNNPFVNYNKLKSKSIAHFYKRPHNYSIKLNCTYNKQYTADGDDGIIDGQFGDKDWRKGGWQGYQSQNFEAIIDMQQTKSFDEISANFLQDTRSWILMPTKVEFYTSDDNVNFKLIASEDNKILADDYNIQTNKFSPFMVDRVVEPLPTTEKKEGKYKARYIKVKAYNFGKLPNWHLGKGGDAFIFVDEIEIR